MSEPDPQFTDEMISAYLDGELSDSERELVERVVEDNPQYRRMLEELQALRDSLKSLPRFQLDHEFHQRVLERATERTKPHPTPSIITDQGHAWRRLAWVAGTIAAGLMLMLFLPGVLDWFQPGRINELGQVPQVVTDAREGRPESSADSEEPRSATSDLDLVESNSGAPSILSQGDREPPRREQPRSYDRAEVDNPEVDNPEVDNPEVDRVEIGDLEVDVAEGVNLRGATRRAASGVAANDASADDALADEPMPDQSTSFARINPDLDAVVYWSKVADATDESLAQRGLYRISRLGGKLPVSDGPTRDFDKWTEGQPQLLVIQGSPEQIALSLTRIKGTDSPGQALDRLTVNEWKLPSAEAEPLVRGRAIAPTDRYAIKDEQDRLRRSSDLYIDLDAADTNPVVVNPVARESNDYQRLLGFIIAESSRSVPESDGSQATPLTSARKSLARRSRALDVTAQNPDQSLAEPEALTKRPTPDLNQASPTARNDSPADTAAAGSRASGRIEELADQGVTFYWLTPTFGRQAADRSDDERAPTAGRLPVVHAMVDELKSIPTKSQDGTLRVLLVLSPTEAIVNSVPQSAIEPPAASRPPAPAPAAPDEPH